MKKNGRRYLCFLLVFLLVLGTVPVSLTRAEEGGSAADPEEGFLSAELICGKEEHVHTEECYELRTVENGESGRILICEKTEGEGHVHGDSCYQTVQKQICGQEESEGHSHSDECYSVSENLNCGQEEHAHGEGCYDENGELTCGTEEHSHDAGCYEKSSELTCGQEETSGHTHGNDCYTEEKELVCTLTEEVHFHTEGCYTAAESTEQEKVLVCGQEEHQHSQECYQVSAPEAEPSPAEPEPANPQPEEPEAEYYCGHEADAHTKECFDESGNVICNNEAHTHTHTQECLTEPAVPEPVAPAPEEPEVKYYCGHEADAHTKECFDESGNVICNNEAHTHTHTQECLEEPAAPVPEEPEVKYYCGHEADAHTKECFDENGNVICKNEAHTHTHTQECLAEPAEETEEGNWKTDPEGSLTTAEVGENSYTVTVRSAVNVRFLNEEGSEIEPNEEQDAQRPQGSAEFLIGMTGSEPEGLGDGGLAVKASDGENEIDLTLKLVEEGGKKYLAYEQPYDTNYCFVLTMAEENLETGYTLGIQLYVRNSDLGAEDGEELGKLAETSLTFTAAEKEAEGEWKVESEGKLSAEKTGENEYLVTADVKTNVRFMTADGEEIELTEKQLEQYPRPEGRMNFLLGVEKDGQEMLDKVLNGNSSVKVTAVEDGVEKEAELYLFETGGKRYLAYSLELGSEGSFRFPVMENGEIEEDYRLELSLYGMQAANTVRKSRAAGSGEEQSLAAPRLLANTGVDMEGRGNVNVSTASIDTISAEKLLGVQNSVTISSTASNSDVDGKTRFWVNISDMSGLIKDNFVNNQLVWEDPNSGEKVTIYLDEANQCIYYDLNAGKTLGFTLGFLYPNGISGKEKEVTITVLSQEYTGNNAPVQPSEETALDSKTIRWTGEFGWESVSKTRDQWNLKIDGTTHKLDKNINYTISAASLNGEDTGEIWTEKLTFEDTLILPAGVTLPAGYNISGGKIVDASGNPLFEMTLPDSEYEVKTMEVLTEDSEAGTVQKIHFITERKVIDPKQEMENPQIGAVLYAPALDLDPEYDPKSADNNNKITNEVKMTAKAYNCQDELESDSKVETIIQEMGVELSVAKAIPDKKASYDIGENVPYEIVVKNTGSSDAEGVTVKDTLPKELTLTDDLIEALFGNGSYSYDEDKKEYTGEDSNGNKIRITKKGEGAEEQFTVEWLEQNIPCNGSEIKYTITAQVKNDRELLAGTSEIKNVAEVEGKTGDASFTYNKPNVSVAKSNNASDTPKTDGDFVEYTVVVTNEEDYALNNVIVTDILPEGLILIDDEGKEVIADTGEEKTVTIGGEEAKVTHDINGVTKIEWVLNTLEGKKSKTFQYQVKVSVSDIPNQETTVKLNNRAETNYGGQDNSEITVHKPGLESDKKILTDDGKELESSEIHRNEKVIYKLTLSNTTEAPIVVTSVEDILPKTADKFQWIEEKNLIVTATGDGSDFESYAEATEEGAKHYFVYDPWNSKIEWKNVSVGPGETLIQTIELIFPDGTEWDNYAEYFEQNSWDKIQNKFYYEKGHEVIVEHSIGNDSTSEIYMQKGVYQLGGVSGWGGYGSSSLYTGNSKYYYISTENTYVTYYFMAVNTGTDDVTIPYAVDILPEGVEYCNMIRDVNNWGVSHLSSPWGINDKTISTQGNTFVRISSADNRNYSWRDVVVTKTSDSNTGKIRFDFTCNGEAAVLKPNEGICFAYNCKVDKDKTGESINMVALAVDNKNIKVNGEISVTHSNDKPELRNDGSCEKLPDGFGYADNTEDAIEYGWLESSVAIVPAQITPGLTKKAVQYMDKIPGSDTEIWKDIESGKTTVLETSKIKWEISMYNDEGGTAIQNYTLKDLLPYPYEMVDVAKAEVSVYDASGNKTYSGTVGPDVVNENNYYTYESGKETDAKVYQYSFEEEQYKIVPGGHVTLTVYSKMEAGKTGSAYQGSFLNRAQLRLLGQDFSGTDVTKGEYVPNNPDKYLQASDSVFVGRDCATNSYKQIAEIGAESTNYGTSDGSIAGVKNYIEIEGRDVEYSLIVTNISKSPLTKFNLIDRMPEVGDRGTVDYINERYSEFTVNLALDPMFRVYRESANEARCEELSNFSVAYSDKVQFDNNDWNGDSEGWSNSRDGAKSFRVTIQDDVLREGERYVIKFRGVVGTDAKPGMIAWNSFGYRYYAYSEYAEDHVDRNTYLTAAPPKVGVKIPNKPVMVKKVVDEDGNDLGVDASVKFRFKIYNGDATQNSNLEYRVIEVAQGMPTSLNLIVGNTYTIEEDLSNTVGYTLEYIHMLGDEKDTLPAYGKYVFTYQGEAGFAIEAVNKKAGGSGIKLPNTGGPGTLPIVMSELMLAVAAAFIWAQNNAKKKKVNSR